MIYTVGEMAQKLGVPASTLRYYDKEGLLPFVERSSGGIRMFRENDFEWLQVIRCMKKAGMSIKDIRQYIELSMQGDDTIDTRLEMFRHQREVLTQQIQQLQHTLETVEYKCCCILYTSDAADDLHYVYIGSMQTNKKKKTNNCNKR